MEEKDSCSRTQKIWDKDFVVVVVVVVIPNWPSNIGFTYIFSVRTNEVFVILVFKPKLMEID